MEGAALDEAMQEVSALRREKEARAREMWMLRSQLRQRSLAGGLVGAGVAAESSIQKTVQSFAVICGKLQAMTEEHSQPLRLEDLGEVVAGVDAAMREVGASWEKVADVCTPLREARGPPQERNGDAQQAVSRPGRMEGLREDWKRLGRREFRSMNTFIFDCDGVLWNVADPEEKVSPTELQSNIIGRVNELLRDENKRVLFLTNNSHATREEFINKLAGYKIDFGDLSDANILARFTENMVTAGFTTAKLLKQMGVKRPFVLTSTAGILSEMEDMGITDYTTTYDKRTGEQRPEFMQQFSKQTLEALLDRHKDADAVVMAWDFNLTTLKIGLAANILRLSMEPGGAPLPLVTCSSDSSGVLGSAGGRKIRAVGNGAMGHAVASCFDPPYPQSFCGKPSDSLLKLMRDAEDEGGYSVEPSTAVMIGDTIETDIEFANNGAMKSLFVLTGVNTVEDMEASRDPRRHATWILPSFADV